MVLNNDQVKYEKEQLILPLETKGHFKGQAIIFSIYLF